MISTNDEAPRLTTKVVAQTYLNPGKNPRRLCVSTVDRDSSACTHPTLRYSETLVWSLDEKGGLCRIEAQFEDAEGSLRTHLRVVERIHATGSPDEPEETDDT